MAVQLSLGEKGLGKRTRVEMRVVPTKVLQLRFRKEAIMALFLAVILLT